MSRYYYDAWGLERTDHAAEIRKLRDFAYTMPRGFDRTCVELAADMLMIHDETGHSLDNWKPARDFVEHYVGAPILPNFV